MAINKLYSLGNQCNEMHISKFAQNSEESNRNYNGEK